MFCSGLLCPQLERYQIHDAKAIRPTKDKDRAEAISSCPLGKLWEDVIIYTDITEIKYVYFDKDVKGFILDSFLVEKYTTYDQCYLTKLTL